MTRPSVIDASKYRRVKYLGGRILQARELELMQSLDKDVPSKGKFEIGAVYQEGTTLNVRVVVSGTTVTLLPIETGKPMLVFVNGAFEAFTAQPTVLTVRPSGSTDTICANYTLWRVTANGENASLPDPALVDASTLEPTAEMGQLQIVVGADDHGPIDPLLMLARNTAEIPVATLVWGAAGALSLQSLVSAKDQALASKLRAGLVRTSTDSAIVVSGDDSRLTDVREPQSESVNTSKVRPVELTGSNVNVVFTENGTEVSSQVPGVKVADTDGGINAKRLFWDTWGISIHNALGLLSLKVQQLFTSLVTQSERITTLEETPALNLDFHVGQKLGTEDTHPPVVDSSAPGSAEGFEVWSTGDSAKSAFGSYSVVNNTRGSIRGGIKHDGDYELSDPSFSSMTEHIVGGTSVVLRKLSQIALALGNHLKNHPSGGGGVTALGGDVTGAPGTNTVEKIRGKSTASLPGSSSSITGSKMVVFNGSANGYELADIPSGGGGGVSTLGGDVTGAPSANTVARIQGRSVASAAPATGQALVFNGTQWAPGAVSGGGISMDQSWQGMNGWSILKFGNYRVAFGAFTRKNGETINPPAPDRNKGISQGSWGSTTVSAAIQVSPADVNTQVLCGFAGNTLRVTVNVWGGPADNPSAKQGILDNTYAMITITAIGQDV